MQMGHATCASSCAFLLALPRNQVCVYPSAWLGYHTKDETVEWERGRAPIARGTRECR
jgi:hypothetical protein